MQIITEVSALSLPLPTPLFSEALEVTYRSEYPRWVPHEIDQIAFEMLLTKSDDWKYEKEFRAIGALNMEKEHLNVEGDCFRLPPGALLSVIVGCEADYQVVEKVVSSNMSGVPIKRAVSVPDQYRLRIEP